MSETYIFRNIDFKGGLNIGVANSLLKDNELLEAINIDLGDEIGVAKKTKGYEEILHIAFSPPKRVEGLYKFYRVNPTENCILICINGKIYRYQNGLLYTFANYISGNYVRFITINNKLYFFVKDSYALKWDGSYIDGRPHILNMGVGYPVTACGGGSGEAGVLNGTYYYRYTWVTNDGLESVPSPITPPLPLENQKAVLTDMAVWGSSYVIKKNIYRIGGANAVWRFVASIDDNLTTYTDNTPDEDLGAELESQDNYPPTLVKNAIFHETIQRLFLCDDDYVYYSKRNYYSGIVEPEYYPPNNWLKIGFQDGQKIVNFAIFRNTLYVFKDNSIYTVDGDEPFRVRKISGEIGCDSENSIAVGDNILIWLFKNRVMVFDGNRLDDISLPISKILDSILPEYYKNVQGIYYDKKYYLAIPTSATESYVLVFDFKTNCWYKKEYSVSIFTLFNKQTEYDLWCGDYQGHINKLEIDDYYFGNSEGNIKIVVQTKFFDFNKPDIVKRFRKGYVAVEGNGKDDEIEIIFITDLGKTYSKKILLIPQEGSYWGKAKWGIDIWGVPGKGREYYFAFPQDFVGRSISFKFINNSKNYLKLIAYGCQVVEKFLDYRIKEVK
jgi:hypothetical protein